MKDESRSLAAAVQTEAANHLELLPLRAVVVNVQGKDWLRVGQVGAEEANVSEPLMRCRNR